MEMRRIGVLTSGGDAPGMNPAIRAVVRTAVARGVEVIGVRGGYRGLVTGDFTPLGARSVGGILSRGGTMLGSARLPEFKTAEGRNQALAQIAAVGMDGLVVVGGNGSQAGALSLHQDGFPVCGVASTIDNDLAEVDITIGVDTALNTALSMIDRLRDTASSHHRAFVIETMGRNSGYLALMAGISGGAELILTPEKPLGVDAVIDRVRSAYEERKAHCIVIVAEGSPLKATALVDAINQAEGRFEARLSVLGHVQRGGPPLLFDRVLGTRSGAAAATALLNGTSGQMAGLVQGRIDLIPMEQAIAPCSKVSEELWDLAEVLAR